MLDKIFGAIAILTFIWLVAFKKIDKEENLIVNIVVRVMFVA